MDLREILNRRKADEKDKDKGATKEKGSEKFQDRDLRKHKGDQKKRSSPQRKDRSRSRSRSRQRRRRRRRRRETESNVSEGQSRSHKRQRRRSRSKSSSPKDKKRKKKNKKEKKKKEKSAENDRNHSKEEVKREPSPIQQKEETSLLAEEVGSPHSSSSLSLSSLSPSPEPSPSRRGLHHSPEKSLSPPPRRGSPRRHPSPRRYSVHSRSSRSPRRDRDLNPPPRRGSNPLPPVTDGCPPHSRSNSPFRSRHVSRGSVSSDSYPPTHLSDLRRSSFNPNRDRLSAEERHYPPRRRSPSPPPRRFSDDRRSPYPRNAYGRRDFPSSLTDDHSSSWDSKVNAFMDKIASSHRSSRSPPSRSPFVHLMEKPPSPSIASSKTLAPEVLTETKKNLPANDLNLSPSGPKECPDAVSPSPGSSTKSTKSKTPPPGVELTEEEENAEELKATPLVRYVGKRLNHKTKKNKNKTIIRLEGVFRYNLLSLLTRTEWVAAKSIQLLENAGYDEEKLYTLATTGGDEELERELKSAVFTGKVDLGNKPELVAQVLRVIEYIVKYFTSAESDNSTEGESDEERAREEEQEKVAEKAVKSGVSQTLKLLAEEADLKKKEEERKKKEEEEAAKVEVPAQPPSNPWSYVWDRHQAENFKSLADMKNFIAKDLLRTGDDKLARKTTVFETAQEMMACLVIAGYSRNSLTHQVMQTDSGDILPPKELFGVDKNDRASKKYLFDIILDRLNRMRKSMPVLSDFQLEYCVRKCLVYLMRGCDKMPQPPQNPPGCNVVYNYLPPGLREIENGLKKEGDGGTNGKASDGDGSGSYVEEGLTPKVNGELAPEEKESTDPLNSILRPGPSSSTAGATKPDEMPSRKYLVGCFHTEWVVIKGKAQVYEISVFMSDMSSITVYTLTEDLKKRTDILENLGFVANPDRNEFYYVQVGVGCFKAVNSNKAVEQLAEFLDKKRNYSTSENKNNGLVLVCYNEEELSVIVKLIEQFGHKNILLESVKGFGCLENYFNRNKSKRLSYSGPKLNMNDDGHFYHSEVQKNLKISHLVSKSKAEGLYNALELFLDGSVTFKNFIHPYCYPSFSPKMEKVKKLLRQTEEMFPLEVFMASELRAQRTNLVLEGVFQPLLGRDLRDKCTVVSSRVCRVLVEAGFDKSTLAKCCKKDPEFTINSSVILDQMSMTQRLNVMDQTMRCIRIIMNYFRCTGDNK